MQITVVLSKNGFKTSNIRKMTSSILPITFNMESPVNYLQSIFGRKRNNRSTCDLSSQDTDITSRSVSNRSTSITKLGFWSPMILRASFKGLMVECCLFCLDPWFAVRLRVIQLCAHSRLCQQNHYLLYRSCRSASTEYHD